MGRKVRKTLNRIMVLFLSIIFVFGSTSIPGLSSFVQASENEAMKLLRASSFWLFALTIRKP